MYIVDHCPACLSKNVKFVDAKLARFISWRISGHDPGRDLEIYGITCGDCSYVGSTVRFNEEENTRLYKDYRGADYNKIRSICEPKYLDKIKLQENREFIEERYRGINQLIEKIDAESIKCVLDYGGGDGFFIPQKFKHAEKYVHDISNVPLLPGVKRFDYHTNTDFLMCCQVLEHSSDLDATMTEITHLIKPHTWAYFEVPNNPKPYVGTFHEHLNIFNRQSLETLLKRFGYSIVSHYEGLSVCLLTRSPV